MFAIRPTYLIMVTAENNNKYYNCFPEGDNFRVEYGRVNSTKTITNYPMSKWESQISSKIKKGYKDVTDLKTALVEEIKTDGTKYKDIENESVRKKMGQCGINNLKMKFDQKYVWNEIYQFYLSAVK